MSVNEKMTAIANAIRGKTGGAEPLTLDQMAAEIEGIQAGEEVYVSPHGTMYYSNMVLDCKTLGITLLDADKLKRLELTNWNPTDAAHTQSINQNSLNDVFASPSLETLILPKLQYGGHYWARNANGLKTAQLGSVGFPVLSVGSLFFRNCIQSDLTIIVYVDATTLADAATILNAAPWGATNAIIIYRNSTTGEVITE